MTGYGKAEVNLAAGKLTIEIRTLNSKSADISIKSSLLLFLLFLIYYFYLNLFLLF